MKIVYKGPATDGVIITESGQWALPGEPVDVDDDLGRRLCEQDVWEAAKAATKKADD